MRRRPLLTLAAGIAAPSLAATPALAQPAYPDRPIRFIVPFPAGGGTDTWARIAAEGMQAELGQNIVIENRGGAGGLLGTEIASKAAPDGYGLLFTITTHVQTPVVFRRWPYQLSDFAPIGRLSTSNTSFLVGPRVPAQVTTMPQFLDWARGRDLSLGSYATGSTGHAFALMFAEEARLTMTHVAYRGENPMVADMLAGQIHGGFNSMAAAGEQIHSGRLRSLGATGERRIPSLPNIPTLRELGFSDRFSFSGFSGLLAPARTPAPVLARLAEAFRIAAAKPETTRKLLAIDTIPSFLGPEEFGDAIQRMLRDWTAIADRLNLYSEG
jgi:tripartite-type tricarboxylate transporter receptor subunit TctC